MYFEGELPTVAYGNNCNGNNGWNDWSWIIGLALVGGLFGNGGFGFGNGGRVGYGCGTPATVQDVASGFSTSEIMSDLNDIIIGQAQMQNFINQGFAGVNATVTNGFANLNTALCTLGYNTQAGFNAIGTQVADCCCRIERGLDNIRYENARSTCDIIRANQDNTRQILDFLTGEKIASLQAENSGLKAQISNDRQSAYIIDALSPKCPQPAYVVPNPNCCYNYGVYPVNGCGASIQ